MSIRCVEVVTEKHENLFLTMPKVIYKDDPNWIPHLEKDIRGVFNRDKNPEYKVGDTKRWLAFDGDRCVGRIAAFYRFGSTEGGIGFFESINDETVCRAMFDEAEGWLKEQGIETIQAPINFGERDRYWGLLVEFKGTSSYQEPYNPMYYKDLIEAMGYEKAFEQTTSETDPETVAMSLDKFVNASQRNKDNKDIEIRHFEKGKLRQYAEDFVTIYNAAWKQHEHYKPLTVEGVVKLFKSMKMILREDIIWFTYAEGKPVAFYVSVIDVNQWFKYVNGKLNWWGKLKFLWAKYTVPITRIRGIVFGVVPEYQGKGLYSGMIVKIFEVFQKDKHLKSTELAWIGDFNPRMHALFRSLGAKKTKIHWTFERRV